MEAAQLLYQLVTRIVMVEGTDGESMNGIHDGMVLFAVACRGALRATK
jgi:hypothetical protein